MLRLLTACVVCGLIIGCGGGDLDDLDDAIDAIDVDRKPIDTSRVGINAFANDPRFGTVCEQLAEVREVLKVRFIRVLFDWNDGIQVSPEAAPFWGFYDEIANCIPEGADAIAVLTGVPSWMGNSAAWIDGDPRKTFVERWVRRVARRYSGHGRIAGWQIWNEPNAPHISENTLLALLDSPQNYVQMLAGAYGAVKEVSPQKLVIAAATTAVAQNYPGTLDYNKGMRAAGAEAYADVWAIHYYGRQFENVVRGVDDFLNGLTRPIWITESGAQGVNEQLAYVEQVWPFLQERVPGIARYYYYTFTSDAPAASTYGLRNLDPQFPVSDLYVYLRDQ